MYQQCTEHQKRLWFIDRFERDNLYTGGPVYHNLPLLVQLPGNTPAGALGNALREAVKTYPVFGTCIREQDGLPVQYTSTRYTPMPEIHNLPAAGEAGVIEFCLQQLAIPFNLEKDILCRWLCITAAGGNMYLLIIAHHIIADRQSLQQLWAFIGMQLAGNAPAAAGGEAPLSFAEFADWQNSLTGDDLEPFVFYWKKKLANLQVLYLDTSVPRAAIHIYEYDMQQLELPASLSAAITAFCQQQQCTPDSFFHALFAALLHRYTGLHHIVTGRLEANRSEEGTGELAGPVANLITVKHRVAGSDTWTDFLQSAAEEIQQSRDFTAMPFESVVLAVNPENDMSRTALFDVLFQYEDEPAMQYNARIIELNHGLGKYDLNLLVKGGAGTFTCYLTYNKLYFSRAHIQRLLQHFETLAAAVQATPTRTISELDYLTGAEQLWWRTAPERGNAQWPGEQNLVQLFEAQVARTPAHTAVVFEQQRLTYASLNAQVNQLAHYLNDTCTIQPGEPVAVLLERGEWMVTALLAVLKTGGAYVPVDPAYPAGRIAYMLNDCRARIVIDSKLLDAFGQVQQQYATVNPGTVISPDGLAYVIYTSGSTGQPKGTLAEHRNLVRLFFTEPALFDFNSNDAWLLFHSFCFDFSVWEMYGALLFGGKLVVLPAMTARDPEAVLGIMQQENITVLNQTPSAFYTLAQQAISGTASLPALRYAIFGGEALQPAKLAQWHAHYPQVALINMYGITETTVHVTFKHITTEDITAGVSNIGKPIPTLYTYILDQYQQPLPVGITGELYVGGEGVARGYLGKPELTAERFISDPFHTGKRLYRSGDTARLLENGDLEYAGRADDQVKIRGYRIEPGEIEAVLERQEGVAKAVVLPRRGLSGEDELYAFLVIPGPSANLSIPGIRSFAGSRLPAYMVPAQFILLPALPLTANGKTDKKALLRMEAGNDAAAGEAPVTPTEIRLAAIWAELLQKEGLARTAHFFHLGGHSLKAVQLQLQIRTAWQVDCRVSEIFIHPVLRDLAVAIDSMTGTGTSLNTAIPVLPPQPYYPASFAQKRLWFLEQFTQTAYTIDITVRLHGTIAEARLQRAVEQLVQRHEILRTHFVQTDDVYQVIDEPGAVPGVFSTVHTQSEEQALAVIHAQLALPFNLGEGPLFKAILVYTGNGNAILLLLFHHIIFDDWSSRILLNELFAFYGNEQHPLPGLRIQYKEYAHWKNQQRDTTAYQQHRLYWLQQFSEPCPPLELPCDAPRPKHKTYNGHTLYHTINGDQLLKMKAFVNSLDITLSSFLLACFGVLLYRYTGQPDMVIGMPVADRDHPDLDAQVGLYQNTLPIRIQVEGNAACMDYIKQVHQTVIQGFDHKAYPFDELVEQLSLPRDLSRTPLFDVMFTHQLLKTFAGPAGGPGDLLIEPMQLNPPVSKFDCMLNVAEGEAHIELALAYNTDLFIQPKMERFLRHFTVLLGHIPQQPGRAVAAISCLTTAEYTKLNPPLFVQPVQPVQVQWQQALQQWPGIPALQSETLTCTLAELHQLAATIAATLQQHHGCRKGDRIAVYCSRTEACVLMEMAIFLLEGCYLPVDVQLPAPRRDFILQEAQPVITVTDDETEGSITGTTVNITVLKSGKAVLPVQEYAPSAADAFAIYTSGTTGTPKGILQTYSTISNLIQWERTAVAVQPGQRYLQFAAISFDVSVQDIAFALANGLTLCIPPPGIRKDPDQLYAYIIDQGIEILSLPYSVLRAFMAAIPEAQLSRMPVRHIITYGEQLVLSPAFIRYLNHNPQVQLHNHYGPTETHVVTAHTCTGGNTPAVYQPIGLPIANNGAFVLDGDGQPVPVGVTGMLYITGASVFNRYIDPALPLNKTTVQNIADGAVLFCTGDEVRWTEEGLLVYMGRKDQQIKISGNRVETGEIEQVLLRHPAVREAIITALKTTATGYRLHAFYTSAENVVPAVLQAWCKQYLPPFMVPAVFTPLDVLPLNKNGKVDREQLAAIAGEHPLPAGDESTLPASLPALQSIWEALLTHPVTPPGADFFASGGHSLTAAVLLNRIREQFQCAITIEDIFERPVLLDMAAFIDAAPYESWAAIPVQAPAADYPLSPPQLSFWLKIQDGAGKEAYTISAAFLLEGQLQIPLLQEAVQDMVQRCEILRTVFRIIGGQPRQVVLPAGDTLFTIDTGAAVTDEGFDPGTWPLFSIQLHETAQNQYRFFISMHHLVSDGWTLELFMRELLQLYMQRVKGMPFPAPPAKQYRDYAVWMNAWCAGEAIHADAAYWRRQLDGVHPQHAFATLRQTELFTGMAGDHHLLRVQRTAAMEHFLQEQQVSMYVYLVSVLFLLKYRYGKEQDLLMASVSAGRIHKDLEQMMGYFLNTYYLRIRFDAHGSIAAYLRGVKQVVMGALKHQRYPFDEVLGFLGEEKRLLQQRSLHETGITYQQSRYTPGQEQPETPFQVTPVPAAVQRVKDPLWWYFTDDGRELTADVHYATAVYSREAVGELAAQFEQLAISLAQTPADTPLAQLVAGNENIHTAHHQQRISAATQVIDDDF